MNNINLLGSNNADLGVLFEKDIKSTLFLTYNIDLILFENLILRKILEKGSNNNIIFADINELINTEDRQNKFIGHSGSEYISYGIDLSNIFHPKAILLTGSEEVRLLIGSGNLTLGGLSRNRELWCKFTSLDKHGANLIKSFISYINELAELNNIPVYIKERLTKYIDLNLLNNAEENDKQFFFHNFTIPILDQVKERIGKIDKICIIAPFFDKDLKTVDELAKISPNIELFFQKDYTNYNSKSENNKYKIFDFPESGDFTGNLHAKAIIFKHAEDYDLLFGSPNITEAALLNTAGKGNSEIAIFTKNISKESLKDYLPDIYKELNPEDIDSISFTKDTPENELLIKRARILKNGEMEITFFRKVSKELKIKIFVNEKQIEGEEIVFDENQEIGKVGRILSDSEVVKVFVEIDGEKSNTIIALDESKELLEIDRSETKTFNLLKKYVSNESMDILFMARSMDPFIEAKISTSRTYYNEGEISDDENAQAEVEKEKEEQDYYINKKNVDFLERLDQKSLPKYTEDLYLMISKLQSLPHNFNEDTNHFIKHVPDSNIPKKELPNDNYNNQIIKKYIAKFKNNVLELSSLYDKSKKERVNEDEFLLFVANFSRLIPFFNALMRGIEVKKDGINICIAVTKNEVRDLISPLLETVAAFWINVIRYRKFIRREIPIKYFENFYSLTKVNLEFINLMIEVDKSHEDIFLNKSKYDYLLSKINGEMLYIRKKLSMDEENINIQVDILKEKIFDEILDNYIMKYSN